MKLLKKIFSIFGLIPLATTYYYFSIKNRYPCRLMGERINPKTQETIIIYKVLPRKEEFEMNLKDLLDQPLLIEKFHPTEAIRLGFMAFGEIFFNQSREQAQEKYQKIIKKMQNHGEVL